MVWLHSVSDGQQEQKSAKRTLWRWRSLNEHLGMESTETLYPDGTSPCRDLVVRANFHLPSEEDRGVRHAVGKTATRSSSAAIWLYK